MVGGETNANCAVLAGEVPTLIKPVDAVAGTVALICVLLMNVTPVEAVLLNVTPIPEVNPVPFIITVAPAPARVGEKDPTLTPTAA